ncbi:hypothetical protein JJQ72_02880 [Paenibacillus sp. F411]|uniref:hypothetical protein n=1 Tax=Paenibacillus TaxID=44249 RepID=UPI0010FEBDB8|nr:MULTISPECIES: hypothetical protein [Paenibacillus]MBO2942922.1 hypothetical protein [Paenibacillus sp. F411]
MMMRSKYVNGMNEVKADDDLKQLIIRKAKSSANAPHTAAREFRKTVATITVSCLIILLLAIGGPLVLRNGDQANPSTLFSGFVVTAYAADGAPLVVKPDVEFPLGEYSMLMSSVPGFPVTIASEGTEKIELQTSEGQLLLWNPEDSKVIPQGKKATIKSGENIYWTPLVNDDPSQSATTDSILEINAYKDSTKIGSTKIEIKSEDQIIYKGKLIYE